MALDDTQDRGGFADLLAELGDSDVVIEVIAGDGRKMPEAGPLDALKAAVQSSYRALAGNVPVRLETVAVLEEVAKRGLSLWQRVHAGGDGALADTSDASLLKFLARGTLALIAWMDGSRTHELADLQQAIRVLAWGTSITTTAHPVLPASADLVEAIVAWQHAKALLNGSGQARIITNNGSTALDLATAIAEPRALLQSRKLVNRSAEMIFVVEMPDYQGTREWKLKHGSNRTTAHCDPGTMLDRFYRRELDIRPGDALRCRVDFETSYGSDHEVLAEQYRIVEILDVLPAAQPATSVPLRAIDEPEVRRSVEELEGAES